MCIRDRTETVDRSVIKNWIVRGEDGSYTLDKEKAAEYVNNLGYKYDTFGCTRDFRTYDGRIVTISGGDYGWAIDQEAETEALYQAILNGETQVRAVSYTHLIFYSPENIHQNCLMSFFTKSCTDTCS